MSSMNPTTSEHRISPPERCAPRFGPDGSSDKVSHQVRNLVTRTWAGHRSVLMSPDELRCTELTERRR